jgi:hypothetical protein
MSPEPAAAGGSSWIKWGSVTLICAALAFLASPNGPLGTFWRPSPDVPAPTQAQLPLLVLLNASEALAFGFGIAFLLFGYRLVRAAAPTSRALSLGAYLAIAWLLINWWPHDSLHVANGMNLSGLLGIEYGFHITLMIAGVVLVRFFLGVAGGRGLAPRTA